MALGRDGSCSDVERALMCPRALGALALKWSWLLSGVHKGGDVPWSLMGQSRSRRERKIPA
eukprot:12152941-Karenia_brevis.AAC.1